MGTVAGALPVTGVCAAMPRPKVEDKTCSDVRLLVSLREKVVDIIRRLGLREDQEPESEGLLCSDFDLALSSVLCGDGWSVGVSDALIERLRRCLRGEAWSCDDVDKFMEPLLCLRTERAVKGWEVIELRRVGL